MNVSTTRGKSLTRLWTIVEALRAARRGLTATQLIDRTGGSRASIYRDLGALRAAGVPIDKVPSAGEMRHVLATEAGGASYAITPLQRAALLTARRALSALEGTRLMRELDTLSRQRVLGPRAAEYVRVAPAQSLAPQHLVIIDRALEQGWCLRVRYRGKDDLAPSFRTLEPVELRVSAEQPYLVAYDRKGRRFKTYKLARISQVQLLRERPLSRENYEPHHEFGRSRRIWSGPAHEIAVRLHREVARFASEWPLHRTQSITDLPNGDVIVRATVSGLHEPMRWVLSWGRCAEALEPTELRNMVMEELSGALAGYRAVPAKRKRRVSGAETGVV